MVERNRAVNFGPQILAWMVEAEKLELWQTGRQFETLMEGAGKWVPWFSRLELK